MAQFADLAVLDDGRGFEARLLQRLLRPQPLAAELQRLAAQGGAGAGRPALRAQFEQWAALQPGALQPCWRTICDVLRLVG